MVKVAVIGVGLSGSLLIKTMLEKAAQLVAAFTRSSNLGRDVGEVVGFGTVGVPIQPVDQAKEVLAKVKPDICVVQTGGMVADNEQLFTMCAKLGINALTLIEEAHFPNMETSEVSRRLDDLFKKNQCTLLASGYQDGLLAHLVLNLMGNAHNLREVNLSFEVDPDEYFGRVDWSGDKLEKGIEGSGIDQDPEEFKAKKDAEGNLSPDGSMGNVIRWICAASNLEITSVRVEIETAVETSDTYVKSLDRTIPAGRTTGFFENTHYDTKQGIKFHMRAGMKAHKDGVAESFQRWHLVADPDIILTLNPNPSLSLTVTPCVHRIPDVIAARPGFLTTNQLPPVRYIKSLK